MLLSVPEVDVVKDWLDYTNLIIGLGGFTAAIVAVVLARRAQRSADTAITEERRRVFELEILREIVRDLEQARFSLDVFEDPAHLVEYRLRLSLLSTELPFWKKILMVPDTDPPSAAVIEAVGLGEDSSKLINRRDGILQHIAEIDKSDEPGRWLYGSDGDGPTRYFVPDDPAIRQQREDLLEELEGITKDVEQLAFKAAILVGDKLAYDVRQAIESRVLAGHAPRLSWWRRNWWYRV